MKDEEFTLDIIPSLFLKVVKNAVVVACYINDDKDGNPIIVEKAIPKILIEGMKNPTKIFISYLVRPGRMDVTTFCGKRYRKSFTWVKNYQQQFKGARHA